MLYICVLILYASDVEIKHACVSFLMASCKLIWLDNWICYTKLFFLVILSFFLVSTNHGFRRLYAPYPLSHRALLMRNEIGSLTIDIPRPT